MSDDPHPARALEGVLAFWADAGVSTAYLDGPADRLAEGARRLAPARSVPRSPLPSPPPSRGGPPPGAQPPGATDDARALAAAAGDLAALQSAIAAFEGCGLKSGATQAVFARGRPDARIMIIGEGPGAEEDRRGEPFVGPAGRLLDRMLAAGGLSDQVFITNTVFWRPPANRTPTNLEQAACRPFLERAIALVRPQALLLMGGAAAKHLLKRPEGILSLRGRWFDWVSEDGAQTIPALATLHPAFLLRQPAAKAHAWTDILTLLSRLEPTVKLGHGPLAR